jgi:hypothetical protein
VPAKPGKYPDSALVWLPHPCTSLALLVIVVELTPRLESKLGETFAVIVSEMLAPHREPDIERYRPHERSSGN